MDERRAILITGAASGIGLATAHLERVRDGMVAAGGVLGAGS